MVAMGGLEPPTPALWMLCSNQLSYIAVNFDICPDGQKRGAILRPAPEDVQKSPKLLTRKGESTCWGWGILFYDKAQELWIAQFWTWMFLCRGAHGCAKEAYNPLNPGNE